MNLQINQLVKSLLDKDNLEQCSLQELESFADRHPYFGAAQLLLTKKLQEEKSDRYNEQLQKTFLFFHNPLWVQHLLNETGNAEIIAPEKKEEPLIITEVKQEPAIIGQSEISAPAPVEMKEPEVIQPDPAVEKVEGHITETILPAEEEQSIDIPALKIEAIDPATAELTFEPFHTVDYFASQGIKFKEEEKPKDKFGQQLKSFTDWLKTMKRLPVSEITQTVEVNSEQKVEQLAEHSLEEREVVTEAMAEVWEKQGNTAKAIEVYNKLSLLDPSKSPYFAAKIEDLKKIN
ncbi:MAG: hypothetical protein V9F01_02315 [Chitinophagaceae bacterium]